jgi:hypothetical protein
VQTQPMVAPESYFSIDLRTSSVTELHSQEPPTADDPRILLGLQSPDRDWVAFTDSGSFLWHRPSASVVAIPGPAQSWSPDGQRLLLALPYDGQVTPDWRLMTLGDGQLVDVPAIGLWPAWLDERRIASIGFRCTQGTTIGQSDVMVHDVVTGKTRNLTDTPDVLKFELTVSPTGEIGSFVIPSSPSYQLMLVDFATEQVWLAALGLGPRSDIHTHNFAGAWSQDGSLLQFAVSGGHGICN